MDDDATHLSLGEVRRILGRLRAPDIQRLTAMARTWATGLRQHDADDLLNEVLDRVLSGRRPWPNDVPFEIDCARLPDVFATGGRLVRAYFYTALLEIDDHAPLRPLVDWLEYNGYTVVTKPAKVFT